MLMGYSVPDIQKPAPQRNMNQQIDRGDPCMNSPTATLKQSLASGTPAIMVNLIFNSPNLVEYFGGLGFEAVMLDCEHTSASVERIEELVRAARASGIAAIVRPEKLDEALITRYLDCKPAGIMVPHVDDAATAQRIVDMVRYALPKTWQDIVIVAMLESAAAVANIDAILEVEGIDVFFLARVDLSKSLGYQGDKRHPEVRKVVDHLIERIRAAGRMVGAAGDYDQVSEIAAMDVQLIYVSTKALLEPGALAYRGAVQRARA
jgi:2-keto-3-deoxy-L-rhamnonate aldolase RhmA